MLSVVIAIHLMLVLALIGVVLLQKSEGGGFVSSSSGFMTSRGTANVLTRATALLAAGFFITSLALSLLASHERATSLPLLGGGAASTQQKPAPGGSLPLRPLNKGSGGLLNELGGEGTPAKSSANSGAKSSAKNGPAAPAPASSTTPTPAPSGPQVPESR